MPDNDKPIVPDFSIKMPAQTFSALLKIPMALIFICNK